MLLADWIVVPAQSAGLMVGACMNRTKKTASCLLIGTILLAASAFAADDADKDAVVLYFNGRSWNSLSQVEPQLAPAFKKFLVRGVYEGAFAMDPQTALTQYNPNTSYTDMVRRVDRFYENPLNLKTPLSYALILISKDMAREQSAPKKLVSLEAS